MIRNVVCVKTFKTRIKFDCWLIFFNINLYVFLICWVRFISNLNIKNTSGAIYLLKKKKKNGAVIYVVIWSCLADQEDKVNENSNSQM